MNIEFREATTEDVEEMCAVNRASIEGLADESYDKAQVAAWVGGVDPELYPIDSAGAYLLLAERNGDIVGLGWMKPEADEYFDASVDGEITGIYVHPAVAGDGIGSRLYDRLEAFARERGVGSLGLWASLNAASFYDKLGYIRATEQTLEYEDGIEVPVVEMVKRLN